LKQGQDARATGAVREQKCADEFFSAKPNHDKNRAFRLIVRISVREHTDFTPEKLPVGSHVRPYGRPFAKKSAGILTNFHFSPLQALQVGKTDARSEQNSAGKNFTILRELSV
jgi:hypothetical protein